MTKNIKSIFFVLTLVMLLVTIGAVCAADYANSTITTDTSVSEVATVSDAAGDTVAAEPATTSNDNKVDTKTLEKEEKNLKEDSVIIDGVEYVDVYENQIINKSKEYTKKSFFNNCTINLPNDYFDIYTDVFINNSEIKYLTQFYVNERNNIIYINNTVLDCKFENYGTVYFLENNTIGPNFNPAILGTIYTNDTELLKIIGLYNGNNTINNTILNNNITNNGNLTIINSTLNSTITNNGLLNISDDTIFGERFAYKGNGDIIIDDFSRILPYLSSLNGATIENFTFNKSFSFNGENTLINCTFKDIKAYEIISNSGNLTMINCTITNCNLTQGNGALIRNNGITTLKNTIIVDNIINTTYSEIYGFINNQYGSSASLTMNNVTFSNNKIISSGTIFAFINSNNMNINQITDSRFENNTITKSIGDYIDYDGIILYNLYDTTVTNCIFNDNIASAISGSNVNITNSTFKNNKRTVNSRTLDTLFANPVVYLKGENNIIGCQFIDNSLNVTHSQAYARDLHGTLDVTNALIKECIFSNNLIESNSIWTPSYGAAIYGKNLTIENNNFTNNQINTPAGTYSSSSWNEFDYRDSGSGVDIYSRTYSSIKNNNFINTKTNQDIASIYIPYGSAIITNNSFANTQANNDTILVKDSEKTITDNTFNNCSIGFKTLELTAPSKVYSNEDVTVTLNIELAYPDNYDEDLLEKTDYEWYVNGENTTSKDTSKTVSVGTSNVIVYVTPTVSNNRTRVLAIAPTILNDIIITPDNINNYVFDGELIASPNSRLIFQGEFNNLGEIYNNKNQVFFEGSNATFTNTSFKIEANDNTIQNMNIENTDTSEYIITIIGNNNTIQNNTLTQTNNNGKTAAIYILNSNNTLTQNNKLTSTGPSIAIQYGESSTIANTQAILQEAGENNTITQNTITVSNSTDAELDAFSTIEAITAPKGTNTQITYNNITCTGARFNYGINTLENVENNQITYNNITVTGYRYTDGIQVGNGANNNLIANNNINLTCLNTTPVDEAAISYGIIVTSQGGLISDNNTITENTININGAVNYGIEIYTATNTNINNNNITITGVKSMAIGYAHSPNSTVTNNNIIINDDTTQPLNGVTEEIQPQSVGIQLQQDSDNILIENNTITTNDKAKTDKTINTEALNTTIKNNQLTSSTGYGADTIQTTMQDTIIENNTIETTTTLEVPETIITNTPVEITATVTSDSTPINGGVVTFTIGNEAIAQAEVIDGIATTTVTFKQEEDATIIASYTPESTGLSTSSAEATTSIQAPVTQLNIEEIDLTAGETVNLTATVTDQNGNNLNGGKVTFKVNGKTIKDASGKVIYAKVVDGVATVQYTVPENLGGQDINITAVYSGTNKYNKKTTTITTTVTAPEAKLTITPITSDVQTGSTVTLKAKVAIGDKAITTGKIVFKVNGKTVKDANGKVIYAKVDANGEASVDYTIPESFKAGTYNIEAVFTASGYEKLTDNTTMTVVKS